MHQAMHHAAGAATLLLSLLLLPVACGAAWGEQGYIRLHAHVQAKEGLCGIAMAASYPTKLVGWPTTCM